MALLITIVVMVVFFGGGIWALSRSNFARQDLKPDGTMTEEQRRVMRTGIGLTGGTGGFGNPS